MQQEKFIRQCRAPVIEQVPLHTFRGIGFRRGCFLHGPSELRRELGRFREFLLRERMEVPTDPKFVWVEAMKQHQRDDFLEALPETRVAGAGKFVEFVQRARSGPREIRLSNAELGR